MTEPEPPWSRLKSEVYAFVGRNPRSNRRVVHLADLEPDSEVLDIGCGPGAAVRRAARRAIAGSAVGVDASPAMVRIAARRSRGIPNVEFFTAPAESLPFDDDRFTHVWSIHAFHHWNDPDVGLMESLRVVRPGGRVFIAETRGRGTHAMSADRADQVAGTMRDIGFSNAEVRRTWREMVVVGSKLGERHDERADVS